MELGLNPCITEYFITIAQIGLFVFIQMVQDLVDSCRANPHTTILAAVHAKSDIAN